MKPDSNSFDNNSSDSNSFDGDSLDGDSLDEALLEHLVGDRKLAVEKLQDSETAANLDELEQVLAMVDQAPVPARGDDYGQLVWNRLEGKLVSQPSRRATASRSWASRSRASRSWRSWPISRLAQVAAAVLLLALGFLAGRLVKVSDVQVSNAQISDAQVSDVQVSDVRISDQARERLLLAALAEHLDRTERLLTEVSNAPASASGGLSEEDRSEKDWADELLRANRLYRQAALRAGQTRVAALLAELEPIFLELAHAPAEGERHDLQRRVDEKSLLFKVRITEGRLAERRLPTT